MSDFITHISEIIWNMKYRFKEADGTPIDQSLADTWRRVAEALAAAENAVDQKKWAAAFYAVLAQQEFIPAGRIIAGAGTGRRVTLSNCFTMGTIPDSTDGIFTHLREAALTMQQGGGIGYDFSTIRPKGALVEGVAADASGPLTFMDVWDSMCRTVMSAGSRRGAMMATMRCDHPDIEAFIEAKQDPKRLRMFNVSVLVTDAFMAAVKADEDWRLHFEDRHGVTTVERTVRARELWDKIMKSTYDYAEPGVIFIDRVNDDHNLAYLEKVATTNPCGEKPMGPYASCLLGSINLAKMVLNSFTDQARVDLPRIERTVKTAIRMMDNVIEVGGFPLEAQLQKAKSDRQLGLGVTGLADMLAMRGIAYGSNEAIELTEKVMHTIAQAAYKTSIELAREKGAFATFDADKFLAGNTFVNRMMSAERKEHIRKHGIRNSLLLSIAPTGTISLLAGNVSSGIEPIFAFSYERKVLQPDGSKTVEVVEDYAVRAYREWWLCGRDDETGMQNKAEDWSNDLLPDYFVSAQTLTPAAHIQMQAIAQKWIDSSISKTVNVPEDISFEAFKAVYQMAYDMGCKGCTTYRPNDVTGSVLSVTEAPKAEPEAQAETHIEKMLQSLPTDQPTDRPEKLIGATYKLKWPGTPHAIYLTINDIVEDGKRRPFEVFINSKNMDNYAWTVALTRMVSAIFRRPHNSAFVAQELKAVFDPAGGGWVKGKFVPSVLAMIGDVIENHMRKIGYIPTPTQGIFDTASADAFHFTKMYHDGENIVTEKQPEIVGKDYPYRKFDVQVCPKCFSSEFKNEGGCRTCLNCGDSKCS